MTQQLQVHPAQEIAHLHALTEVHWVRYPAVRPDSTGNIAILVRTHLEKGQTLITQPLAQPGDHLLLHLSLVLFLVFPARITQEV